MSEYLIKQMTEAFMDDDLRDSEFEEKSIDRIHALGLSQTLGGLLWRLRWGNDQACYQPTTILLVRPIWAQPKLRPSGGIGLCTKVCEAVLHEWLFDACPTCGGRGVTVFTGTDQVHKSCPACAGTLIRRFSDVERAREMGWTVETQRRWNFIFARVRGSITEADLRLRRELNARLE